MKRIILFDMDGTLTPPRQPLDIDILKPLKILTHYCDIGVVSGSDIEYMNEQLKFLILNSRIRYNLHLLPCNGTKHYTPPLYNSEDHKLIFQRDFKKEIGDKRFHMLMKLLIEYQNHISTHYEIPLSGHFISYRESMINWCPIGRNASREERKEFINLDKNFRTSEFRKIILEQLKAEVDNLNLKVTIKLGGETSFDIFPNGWDKTYSLLHFPDHKKWFIGDRCGEGGNDKEIYEHLQPDSFSVKNTRETIEILDNVLIPLFKKEC
jgi:phosphomannomutase